MKNSKTVFRASGATGKGGKEGEKRGNWSGGSMLPRKNIEICIAEISINALKF